MKPTFAIILLQILCTGIVGAAQSDIGLAPGFGNGMVLQRGPNTLLRGQGPAGKNLLVRFKAGSRWISPAWKCPVDASGKWRLEVNLNAAEFQRAQGSWSVVICEEKNRKNQQEYTGILPGDVILVAGWEGQGVQADPKEFESEVQFARDQASIRFLDLNRAAAHADATTGAGLEWRPWPQGESEVRRYSSLSLRLAHMLALKKCPELTESENLGIVLAPRWLVQEGLELQRLGAVRMMATNDTLWTWITETTSKAQTARAKALIYNKRHGIVADLAPILDYDPALIATRDVFDAKKAPREWFTFAGAVWSYVPGAVGSAHQ